MLLAAAARKVTVQISGSNTSVDIGRNTHGLPYTPDVYAVVVTRTATTGQSVSVGNVFWDRTAPTTGDGGNAVRIGVTTAPGSGNVVVLDVYLGPQIS